MKRSRSGFTLLEVMVGSLVSIIVCAAAFAFAKYQTRMLGLTSNTIDMTDSSRSVIDYLADDLRHAGTGVGYKTDNSFGGLLIGNYTVDGVAFSTLTSRVNVANAANMPTDDVGIVLADGGRSTIAGYSFSSTGQLCTGTGLNSGELAVMRSEDGLASRTVRIDNIAPSTCSQGQCVGGCSNFVWTTRTGFESDSGAVQASYLGGEIAGGLKTIVWFVEASDTSRPGVGSLRRAVFDGANTCSSRGSSCGVLQSEYVETLQMQVWRWDSATSAWVNVSTGPINTRDRLRVDVEVVVRSRVELDRYTTPVELRLETGTCAPNCNTRDRFERRVLRTSVDIRNSARMRLR